MLQGFGLAFALSSLLSTSAIPAGRGTFALDELRTLAEQGDVQAQSRLADAYAGAEDPVNAMVWYRKAAEQGNAHAQWQLGRLYEFGSQGVRRDLQAAVCWYLEAAAQGDPDAQVDLGQICENSSKPDNDLPEAFKWYSLAARKHSALAKARLERLIPKMDASQLAEGHARLRAFQVAAASHPNRTDMNPASADSGSDEPTWPPTSFEPLDHLTQSGVAAAHDSQTHGSSSLRSNDREGESDSASATGHLLEVASSSKIAFPACGPVGAEAHPPAGTASVANCPVLPQDGEAGNSTARACESDPGYPVATSPEMAFLLATIRQVKAGSVPPEPVFRPETELTQSRPADMADAKIALAPVSNAQPAVVAQALAPTARTLEPANSPGSEAPSRTKPAPAPESKRPEPAPAEIAPAQTTQPSPGPAEKIVRAEPNRVLSAGMQAESPPATAAPPAPTPRAAIRREAARSAPTLFASTKTIPSAPPTREVATNQSTVNPRTARSSLPNKAVSEPMARRESNTVSLPSSRTSAKPVKVAETPSPNSKANPPAVAAKPGAASTTVSSNQPAKQPGPAGVKQPGSNAAPAAANQPVPLTPDVAAAVAAKLHLRAISLFGNRAAVSINNTTLMKGQKGPVQVNGKSIQVRCTEIKEHSAWVEVDGIAGAVELQLGQ